LPEKYKAEVTGICEGSGAPLEWVMFGNAIHDQSARIRNLLAGCSGFISTWKDSGKTFFAKTTDLHAPSAMTEVLTNIKVTFVHQSLEKRKGFVISGFCGCVGGDVAILENGVVFGFNDGGAGDKKLEYRNGQLVTVVCRELAETVEKVSEIAIFLQKVKIAKSYSCLATDGTKENSFVLDVANGEVDITKCDRCLINTNTFQNAEMSLKHHTQVWYRKAKEYNTGRFEAIRERIKESMDLHDIIEIFQLHEPTCNHRISSIANKGTVKATIFIPSERRLILASNKNVPVTIGNDWADYNLDDLFNA
jgi:predicted choloylglycine hydrolase